MINQRVFWSLLFLLFMMSLQAQTDLEILDLNRMEIQKKGMIVLGSWATINVLSSVALNHRLKGSNRYFNQMNGFWNSVNMAIAVGGYFTSKASDPLTIGTVLMEQSSMEKILLFNAALDIGYMVGGVYLIERSKNISENAKRLKGFGQSIILQGGFLLAFDFIMYGVMHSNYLKMIDLVDGKSLSILPIGITYTF
ncbi:MAG: DUF6992 family protein [Cyclobacteriaceae bacterium]